MRHDSGRDDPAALNSDSGAPLSAPNLAEELTVRFPDPAREPQRPGELEVHATVNRDAKTITYELPDRTRTTLDVVTARALQMILREGVFGSQQPTGPSLSVERRPGVEPPTAGYRHPPT